MRNDNKNIKGTELDAIEIHSPRKVGQPEPHPSSSDDSCCSAPPNKEKEAHIHRISYLPTLLSFTLLVAGIALNYYNVPWFTGYLRFIWFVSAYVPVGLKVLIQAGLNILQGNIFNEFFLMGIATLGAFYIGEYAEGVAVMLFYVIGEHFQESAVRRSRKSIKDLIDNRPDIVTVIREADLIPVHPNTVGIGETIQIKAGEKIPLDGYMMSENSSFASDALTGESIPQTILKGEKVLAGMVNLGKLINIKVTAIYENSTLSKILRMVDQAGARKAKTQKFITRFAKVYTPVVVFLALALVLIPYLLLENYDFDQWLYRALVFLVISCPCALVISIPLGYFGGIGAASKNGILFKGSNFLDQITQLDVIVLDKTGTLTKGVFQVDQIIVDPESGLNPGRLLSYTAALESKSNHPIAKALTKHAGEEYRHWKVSDVEEVSGFGLKGTVEDLPMMVGNVGLFQEFGILYPLDLESEANTLVAVAINGKYVGHITIADVVKDEAFETIRALRKIGIKDIMMLSGDKNAVVASLAKKLSIDQAFGGLLPQDKVAIVEDLKKQNKKVAFVGDGINDAPVITLADVGIAMGGLGSDAAIETADVVIQNDRLSQIVTAIQIGRKTRQVVWQNIALAFGVKALVLFLGATGEASLWEAVFADVGVALLAILNAIRIQNSTFSLPFTLAAKI
jgi:Cd2+/Zn2+-exporting ATPase